MSASTPSSMTARLRDVSTRPLVLDGGLASELERQGQDISGHLWSASILQTDPDAIRAVHAAYFAAGADVATTASYQATYDGFEAAGVDRAQTTALLRRSVEVAARARADAAEADEQAGREARPRWVVGSIGPYGAMRADGSEYTGDYGLTVEELRAFHRPRLEVMAQACAEIPDAVLGVETVPSLVEVEAVVRELDRLGVPAWVSVTPEGGRLRTGEPVEEAFWLAAESDNVLAISVNCCHPDEVDRALDAAGPVSEATGTSLIAYPNTGEGWDAVRRVWTGEPGLDAERVEGWRRAGARGLGGCCRVGPPVIARMAAALASSPA